MIGIVANSALPARVRPVAGRSVGMASRPSPRRQPSSGAVARVRVPARHRGQALHLHPAHLDRDAPQMMGTDGQRPRSRCGSSRPWLLGAAGRAKCSTPASCWRLPPPVSSSLRPSEERQCRGDEAARTRTQFRARTLQAAAASELASSTLAHGSTPAVSMPWSSYTHACRDLLARRSRPRAARVRMDEEVVARGRRRARAPWCTACATSRAAGTAGALASSSPCARSSTTRSSTGQSALGGNGISAARAERARQHRSP